MGKTLKVLVMSALESQAPWPAKQMRVMVWSMIANCVKKSGLGMTLVMLRMYEPCGEDRVSPSEKTCWADVEHWRRRIVMNPSLTFANRASTM